MVFRLFQLTIVKGDYYRRISEQNRTKELIIEPERGQILDRKGFVIVKNTPANIQINPELIDKNDERIHSPRIYGSPEAIAPLIGYEQTADKTDFKNDDCQQKLKLGDKIGKYGVEKLFECDLRGTYGKKLVEIDAKGKYLKTLTVLLPKNGNTIRLSLDLELQKKAYNLIEDLAAGRQGKHAAVIATNPKTGEILVYATSPSFDPQAFEDNNSEVVSRYLTDEQKPMLNKITEGVYPPGSLFKLVVATAGLEEKVIDEKTEFEDTGQLQAGSLKFGNWYFLQYGKTEGMVNIVKAIQRSNDIFFYKAGKAVGPDKIKRWADILGLGKITGIGLNEAEGLIPSTFWKAETLHDRWYTGDTYNLSIGQGYVTVTPLQTVMLTGIFANGGYLCKPQLTKITNYELRITNCQKLPISQKTIDLIREGMKRACTTGGTGWPLFDFKYQISNIKNKKQPFPTISNHLQPIATNSAQFQPIQIACKTGTAESQQAKNSLPHAWVTAFAPFDNPEIAITVLVEEGGQGSDVAGPIVRDVLKAYFERSE